MGQGQFDWELKKCMELQWVYLHHWLHMKTYIINSSEVSGLSVEIHPVILHSLTFSDVLSL
ncbi:hypothetical protein QQ14_15445 [Salmonella enterica subsp. enterica]|uniref:Uncharacterized protein n=2 Tax=Salmonella houtenae TaxID=59205 RepID=A0A2K0JF09_SALHO|nr:hypothetical protein [Salmonella enterica subsp. houtenae]EAB2656479.1 hypothetical protein [Salmonella enterica]ECH8281124.1 hypothetical protein [Salmonella enterica subsp. enterica]PNO33863.1 hypothetical protein RK55_012100 [Salmonella enterica subsp. houtenae serovar 50:g,z51:-]HAC6521034.1 hypothetical protein [Salmonella enterica subsp. houtenae serovar 45:g,z51:-]